MSSYQGHPSWTHWNVSLWIGNDEGLYNLARECLREHRTKLDAARALLSTLQECGEPGKPAATPDGAVYSVRTLLHALRGIDS